MAIGEKDGLRLEKGKKRYLLLDAGDRLHLICADDKLTAAKEKKLRKYYPCAEQWLQEMEIRFSAIPKSQIFGVRVEGNTAGEEILIRQTGQNSRRYILLEDADPELLDAMFSGLRVLPEPRDSASDAWRRKEQDPTSLRQMKFLRWALIAVTVAVYLLFLLGAQPEKLWLGLGLSVSAFALFLVIQYPVYFTLLDCRKHAPKYGLGMYFVVCVPLMILTIRTIQGNLLVIWPVLIWAAVLCAVVTILMWVRIPEIKKQKLNWLAVPLLAFWCCIGVVGHMNTLLDFEPGQRVQYTVEEKSTSTGRTALYYCEITLNDGETFLLTVSENFYRDVAEGDRITVVHHKGGLGMEYLTVVEE